MFVVLFVPFLAPSLAPFVEPFIYRILRFLYLSSRQDRTPPVGFRRNIASAGRVYRFARKPDWVIEEIIRLKAFQPGAGVRAIAMTFNRLHRKRDTVSKSFVAGIVRKHRYALEVRRREIRSRQPAAVAVNGIWGLDLCGKKASDGHCSSILGIIDHGSRFAIMLQGMGNQNFYTLAGHVLIAIGRYGKPCAIRTDNAPQLTSRRFRRFLRMLGIRHQRTDVGCPWQNGRIERLFGTLKAQLDQICIANHAKLNVALAQFRVWYNEIRPHQNLQSRTPVEAWAKMEINSKSPQAVAWYSAWDGLLTGYRIRWL
jgi:putative transposase